VVLAPSSDSLMKRNSARWLLLVGLASQRMRHGGDDRRPASPSTASASAGSAARPVDATWLADVQATHRAYRAEVDHFVRAVGDANQPLLTGPHDGRQALVLADACLESMEIGRPVRL